MAHALALVAFLRKKLEINAQLDAGAFFEIKIKPVVRALDQLHASFRRQWYRRNKPHGFETIQIRLGGQRQRYGELGARLEALRAGNIDAIPELNERPATALAWMPDSWRELAATAVL